MTPHEVAAREAIRATVARYHLGTDHGLVDELVACFAEDGVLEYGARLIEGRAAIEVALSRLTGSVHTVRHHLTTAHVELTGDDTAVGWVYFQATTGIGLDHAGRYVDRYVAAGPHWLLAHRRIIVEWASPDSVVGAVAAEARP